MVVNNPCGICNKAVARNHRATQCDICNLWCHIKCANISPLEYKELCNKDAFDWSCFKCLIVNVPSNEDVYDVLSKKLQSHACKSVKIAHINLNGLENKLTEVKLLLQTTKLDILTISETHLSNDVTDGKIHIPGYKFARKDRDNGNSPWGGSIIYFNENLHAYERKDLTDQTSLEVTCIDITVKSQKLLIASFYRPPSEKVNFFDKFEKFLQPLWYKRKNIIILGDFNINLSPKSIDESYKSKKFIRILKSYCMSNIIKDPTRITATSETLIDHIITSIPKKILESGCFDPGLSDHNIVYAVLSLNKSNSKPLIKTVRSFKNCNTEKLINDMKSVPWHVIEIFDDLEDVTWAWETLHKDVIDSHVKMRKAKCRKNSLPWFNSELRKCLNKRYKLLRLAKGTPKGSQQWIAYKKARNDCTWKTRLVESNYWKNRFETSNSSKEFWKTVREFQGSNKSAKIGPLKDSTGKLLYDNLEKANRLNTYFANVGESIISQRNMPRKEDHMYRVTPTISNITYSKDMLIKSLKKAIKPDKAYGPDNITSTELVTIGPTVADGLHYVAKKSFEISKFPNQWKNAKVKCIHKKGNTLDCGNYRPISLLSLPSKVLEDIVCSQIETHLTEQNLITDHQWGFRKGRSPEYHLLNLTETWRKSLDTGLIIGVIFLDFSKAFDSVCHNTLKMKLQSSGISGDVYDWVSSYLCDRKQTTNVNNISSESHQIKYGVPQGSLIGPTLYGVHSNNLPESSKGSDTEMFADDSTSYCISETVDNLTILLQEAMNSLFKWAQINGKKIQPDKTEIVIIQHKPFTGPLPAIRMGEQIIKYSQSSTCLGIKIDNKLSWSKHIQSTCKNYNAKLKQLNKMKALNRSILESIYFKGILPSVTYGIAIWGNCSPALFNEIEKIHIKAARIIYNIKPSTPDHLCLDITKWKSISYIYKRRMLCILHLISKNEIPSTISRRFIHKNTESLRNKFKFVLPSFKTNIGRYSFHYRGCVLWNRVPDELKSIDKNKQFKKTIPKYANIIENCSFNKECTVISKKSFDYFYF